MMAEEATTEAPEAPPAEVEKETQQTVPYERFQQVTQKAKAEAESRKAIEKKVAELQAALEERENAGLPELDRMRKEFERAQKRAEDAEAKAAAADAKLAKTTKASWVRAAAKDFTDADDAVAFVDLDSIEDDKDAERAVKALAKRKPHLLKPENPPLPGKVLANGQAVPVNGGPEAQRAMVEAQMLADGLRQFASQE